MPALDPASPHVGLTLPDAATMGAFLPPVLCCANCSRQLPSKPQAPEAAHTMDADSWAGAENGDSAFPGPRPHVGSGGQGSPAPRVAAPARPAPVRAATGGEQAAERIFTCWAGQGARAWPGWRSRAHCSSASSDGKHTTSPPLATRRAPLRRRLAPVMQQRAAGVSSPGRIQQVRQ